MKNKNWRNEGGGDLAAAYQKRCHKYIYRENEREREQEKNQANEEEPKMRPTNKKYRH